ncbi:MAG: hypothetical protein Cons2KO_30100 [Congregibacter sp.]
MPLSLLSGSLNSSKYEKAMRLSFIVAIRHMADLLGLRLEYFCSASIKIELYLVDNQLKAAIRSVFHDNVSLQNIDVRHVYEPSPGLAIRPSDMLLGVS